jgi:hypothetical protein
MKVKLGSPTSPPAQIISYDQPKSPLMHRHATAHAVAQYIDYASYQITCLCSKKKKRGTLVFFKNQNNRSTPHHLVHASLQMMASSVYISPLKAPQFILENQSMLYIYG